jgi:transitional endoplasmic reticulum ATPase
LRIYTHKTPLDPELDLSQLSGALTHNFTGADLSSLCREAAYEAAKRDPTGNVSLQDFEKALQGIRPSITRETENVYRKK